MHFHLELLNQLKPFYQISEYNFLERFLQSKYQNIKMSVSVKLFGNGLKFFISVLIKIKREHGSIDFKWLIFVRCCQFLYCCSEIMSRELLDGLSFVYYFGMMR